MYSPLPSYRDCWHGNGSGLLPNPLILGAWVTCYGRSLRHACDIAGSSFRSLPKILDCCPPTGSGPCLSARVADLPLRTAWDRRLGTPFPPQLPIPRTAHPRAVARVTPTRPFPPAHEGRRRMGDSDPEGPCPRHGGRLLCAFAPVRHGDDPWAAPVRLACLRRVASTQGGPEPNPLSQTNTPKDVRCSPTLTNIPHRTRQRYEGGGRKRKGTRKGTREEARNGPQTPDRGHHRRNAVHSDAWTNMRRRRAADNRNEKGENFPRLSAGTSANTTRSRLTTLHAHSADTHQRSPTFPEACLPRPPNAFPSRPSSPRPTSLLL